MLYCHDDGIYLFHHRKKQYGSAVWYFSEFVRRAAFEKAEDMADIEAYNEALDGDGGTRYPMEEVVRMAVEAE
ncbi:DUF6290 family protein [Collinsella aerofaciens]|uniref:DUF6290 family protein n=1 Tax=Collinsella aerofaciens TaxID=74426 RepID=UPI003F61260C